MRLTGIGLAAVMFAAAPPAHAQDLPAANAFVAGLYSAYHGRGPDYLGREANSTFAPPLLRLLQASVAATPADEVGALDGDPICDCQDFKISKVTVQIASTTPGQVHAAVQFLNFGKSQSVGLDLVAVGGHWRVSDVHTKDTPSLVAYLRKSLADAPSRARPRK